MAASAPATLPIEGLARSFAEAAKRCPAVKEVVLSFDVEGGRIRTVRVDGDERCVAAALEGLAVAGEQVSVSAVRAQLARE